MIKKATFNQNSSDERVLDDDGEFSKSSADFEKG
jgi:hypothetical protein